MLPIVKFHLKIYLLQKKMHYNLFYIENISGISLDMLYTNNKSWIMLFYLIIILFYIVLYYILYNILVSVSIPIIIIIKFIELNV